MMQSAAVNVSPQTYGVASSSAGELGLDLLEEFLSIACGHPGVAFRLRQHVLVNAHLREHHVHRGRSELDHLKIIRALARGAGGRSEASLWVGVGEERDHRGALDHHLALAVVPPDLQNGNAMVGIEPDEFGAVLRGLVEGDLFDLECVADHLMQRPLDPDAP